MTLIETPPLTEGELRSTLAEAGVDITATVWPHPGFVVSGGQTITPCPLAGVLFVDFQPVYSAAWL